MSGRLINGPISPATDGPANLSQDDAVGREGVARLTERQRASLRLGLRIQSSKEIAVATGSNHRAVDEQLVKANNVLGVSNRFEAARLFADYEEGVEPLPPAIALPSAEPTFLLPPAWPTAGAAANMLTWKQVASWIAIISIATPSGMTAAGMAIVTLLFLLGFMHL